MSSKKHLKFTFFIIAFLAGTTNARATDVRVGASIGYGGAGIQQPQVIDSSTTTVNRSEGPGMLDLWVDIPVDERWSLGFEDEMGFRLGPFSSGASFLGFTGRYYFMGPQPTKYVAPEQGGGIFIKQWVPFFGFGSGLAMASINRDSDQAPNVTGSGVYVDIKIGFDYQTHPTWGIRPEITTGSTFFSQASPPTTLTMFALQCGFFFYW